MGDLGDPKNIPALLALLAPGFIILWVRSRVVEGPTLEFSQQLFYFALFSAAYYGLAGPLFDVSWGVGLPGWLWAILFYFAAPSLLAVALGWVTQRDLEYRWAEQIGLKLSHRIPTAWDFRFGRDAGGRFVAVTLKDGTMVTGRLAPGSFAAAAKDGRDLYISQLWNAPANGAWTVIAPRRGVLICGDDIRYIEFIGD